MQNTNAIANNINTNSTSSVRLKDDSAIEHRVQGHGLNDVVGGSNLESYVKWLSMLNRCYDTKVHARFPTYIGCSVSDEWLRLSAFNEWFEKVARCLGSKGWVLDKDVLNTNNKVYSVHTCLPISETLNTFILERNNRKDGLPTGVTYGYSAINPFVAKLKDNGKTKQLGSFKTAEEAHQAYKKAKRELFVATFTEEFNLLEEFDLIPDGQSAVDAMSCIMDSRWSIDNQ